MEDLRRKDFLHSLYRQKKNHATRMAIKNACTALKKFAEPLACEKKKSCTNQFFYPPPQR